MSEPPVQQSIGPGEARVLAGLFWAIALLTLGLIVFFEVRRYHDGHGILNRQIEPADVVVFTFLAAMVGVVARNGFTILRYRRFSRSLRALPWLLFLGGFATTALKKSWL